MCVLQVVLSDLQDLQSSWEEHDWEEWEQQQQLTAAEAAVVQQLTASTPLMPDNFSRCAWREGWMGGTVCGVGLQLQDCRQWCTVWTCWDACGTFYHNLNSICSAGCMLSGLMGLLYCGSTRQSFDRGSMLFGDFMLAVPCSGAVHHAD